MIFLNLRKANIFGSCILILICGGLATQVMGIESGLSVDILGPRFFPGMILAIIIALSILVIGITLKSKEGTDTIFATRSGLIHTIDVYKRQGTAGWRTFCYFRPERSVQKNYQQK